MAMTHDYLDFLNERIGIAPTNSEEELQAAEVISDLMSQHDVEVGVEEFDAPLMDGLVPAILAIVCLIGMVLAGVGVLPLTIVGFLLAIIPAVLSGMRLFGRSPRISFGPRAQSQNVIAVHRATGPLVTKGSRTIVIAAHYDTPRENFLYTSPVAPYLALASKLSVPCSFVVAVCALIQILGFLPAPFRIVMWLVGIVAALPAMLPAVGAIAERTAPCTDGANDNKAAVAALLGVLENVRPSGQEPKARPVPTPAEPVEAEETETAETTAESQPTRAVETAPEPVLGVRHGEDVLRSLAILPESCEIEYVVSATPAPERVVAPEPVVTPEPDVEDEDLVEDPIEIEELDAEVEPEPEAEPVYDTDATAETEPAAEDDAEQSEETLASTERFAIVMDDGSEGVGPKDTTGLTAMDEEYDPDATRPAEPIERPDAPSDPEWGKTSFRPKLSSVARRASLFDLPDPSSRGADPFATDPSAKPVQSAEPESEVEHDQADSPETTGARPAVRRSRSRSDEKPKNIVLSLINRLRGKTDDEVEADVDDTDSDEGGNWRGGAAPRSGLRFVEDDEPMVAEAEEASETEPVETTEDDVPTEEELRDAILSLGDDELIAHDIWFVALGGSSLDHAGMRSFLANHRPEIRGCFVINLDCVGAGRLVTLKNEGLEGTRRADRRITRLLNGAAADLHVELGQEPHDWGETDATPAMRSSLRALTLMGLDENGLPALSRTPDDVAENVSGDQAAQVAAMVTEVIRRS